METSSSSTTPRRRKNSPTSTPPPPISLSQLQSLCILYDLLWIAAGAIMITLYFRGQQRPLQVFQKMPCFLWCRCLGGGLWKYLPLRLERPQLLNHQPPRKDIIELGNRENKQGEAFIIVFGNHNLPERCLAQLVSFFWSLSWSRVEKGRLAAASDTRELSKGLKGLSFWIWREYLVSCPPRRKGSLTVAKSPVQSESLMLRMQLLSLAMEWIFSSPNQNSPGKRRRRNRKDTSKGVCPPLILFKPIRDKILFEASCVN